MLSSSPLARARDSLSLLSHCPRFEREEGEDKSSNPVFLLLLLQFFFFLSLSNSLFLAFTPPCSPPGPSPSAREECRGRGTRRGRCLRVSVFRFAFAFFISFSAKVFFTSKTNSKTKRAAPCQVPSASFPLVTGSVTDEPSSDALQCAGMSSWPSSVWIQGASLPSGTIKFRNVSMSARTSGSAFSLTVSAALVCLMKMWAVPARKVRSWAPPASAT